MKRAIPPDGAYLLVDAQPREEGAAYWLRHDLAPRRALFLGRFADLPGPRRLRARLPRQPELVVVVSGRDEAPRRMHRRELMEIVARRHPPLRSLGTAP